LHLVKSDRQDGAPHLQALELHEFTTHPITPSAKSVMSSWTRMVSQGRDTECARFSWPRREVCERCGVTSSLPLTFTSSFETKPTISILSSLTPLPSRSQLPRPSHGTPAAERGTQGHLSGPMGSLAKHERCPGRSLLLGLGAQAAQTNSRPHHLNRCHATKFDSFVFFMRTADEEKEAR
jgi:hypothetical protein